MSKKIVAYAVTDKIGSVVRLEYNRKDAESWAFSAGTEFRNRNMNTPGYKVVPLVASPARTAK